MKFGVMGVYTHSYKYVWNISVHVLTSMNI